jgi:hypothetical protein
MDPDIDFEKDDAVILPSAKNPECRAISVSFDKVLHSTNYVGLIPPNKWERRWQTLSGSHLGR